jgi:hypothetical protein
MNTFKIYTPENAISPANTLLAKVKDQLGFVPNVFTIAAQYGQFCPIAKATEIIGEKWTLLIIRELLMGGSRFNELQRGLSLISPTILSKYFLNELLPIIFSNVRILFYVINFRDEAY